MSETIDQQRRNLVKYGFFSGLTLLVSSAHGLDDNKDAQVVNKIISVRIWPSDVYTRLTIEAEHKIRAKYFNLTDPKRFVIDLLDANLNAVLKNLTNNQFENDPIISSIKVGQFNPTTVRIVIYARETVVAQTQNIEPVNLGGVNYNYRYIFDMYPSSLASRAESDSLNDQVLALLQIKSDQSNISESIVPNKRIMSNPVIQEPSSAPTKNMTPRSGKILIMLDPGHGGEDPGAISAHGLKEKTIVLDIAKKLRDLINSSSSMQAQLTRSQDIFIPLATRVAIARKAKADLFVSIHADAFSSPSARGSSVFILSESGASSAFAKYMATSQNNADLIGGLSFKTKDANINKILLDMTQTYTLRKSSRLGQLILNEMKQINRLHSNSVERAGFAVLKAPDIPSILVESAFVSNPEEAELLRTEEFRQKVAQQIFIGLTQYVKQNYKLG
jgi:N-acetylmuramoyl-L-alanine amidase